MYPPGPAWEMMQEWVKEGRGDDEGPLLCRIRKDDVVTLERFTDQAVYYIIQRLILLTGVDSFSPHDLRGSLFHICSIMVKT